MRLSSHITSQKGFSILMALGSIGVLLVIVIGIAVTYTNEMKLSRMQYDEIFAYAQAEGVFEYAMLKVKNHREGFQDQMGSGDLDARIFLGDTDRTRNTTPSYTIASQSRDHTFNFSGHLIIPLFSGTGGLISGSNTSISPLSSTGSAKVQTITLTADSKDNLTWSIIGMSGSENISLAGSGDIVPLTTEGTIRLHTEICYDSGGSIGYCGNYGYGIEYGGDTIEYFYDTGSTVDDFLSDTNITDKYLLVYSSGTTANRVTIQTDMPFALPTLSVLAESKKGKSMQSIRFEEDKSKYYDAIRYGVYNNNILP